MESVIEESTQEMLENIFDLGSRISECIPTPSNIADYKQLEQTLIEFCKAHDIGIPWIEE